MKFKFENRWTLLSRKYLIIFGIQWDNLMNNEHVYRPWIEITLFGFSFNFYSEKENSMNQ